jgi:HD-GYP domain-containing protein (c-di-GMP phosphodiesterase class II)
VRRVLTSLQHHRSYSEGGYPALEVVRRQGLFVRIVAIADAFDAMTTKRVYQETYLPDRALATLKAQAGTRYDPTLVTAFINCMGVFPVGSLVVLTSGELAVVCETGVEEGQLDRPTVRVISDTRWQLQPPELVDLARSREERRIARCIDPEPLGIDLARYVV